MEEGREKKRRDRRREKEKVLGKLERKNNKINKGEELNDSSSQAIIISPILEFLRCCVLVFVFRCSLALIWTHREGV
ncbi:unnamed protein product [Trifolium pratense]|uniref:Uncharacterized protein n=1 Tax=Trifolium pratense TaxID=57577 RepID=A0ACB0LFH4_TRIPR|nr:unnamed protein product [Trifolium pratense]